MQHNYCAVNRIVNEKNSDKHSDSLLLAGTKTIGEQTVA